MFGCSLWRKWKSATQILIWMEMETILQLIQRLPLMTSPTTPPHLSTTVNLLCSNQWSLKSRIESHTLWYWSRHIWSTKRNEIWISHPRIKYHSKSRVGHRFWTAEIAWHEQRREWVGDHFENVQRAPPMEPILRYSFSFKHQFQSHSWATVSKCLAIDDAFHVAAGQQLTKIFFWLQSPFSSLFH